MYKKLALLLLVQTAAYAMDYDKAERRIGYVLDPEGRRIPEVYNTYFCSLADTMSADDVRYDMMVKKEIFVQLCVQASKATDITMEPFQTLLQKIKTGTIKHHADIVRLTKKDMYHRLLSYIPYGRFYAKINDKITGLGFEIKTEPNDTAIPEDFNFGDFPEDPSQCHSYAGRERKETGEEELKVHDYTFTSNQAHHSAVIESFNTLIRQ
jgi:hypothetical protein